MRTIRSVKFALLAAGLVACGQVRQAFKAPAVFSETVLSPYRKDVTGGFSSRWVAYIIEPEKNAADRATWVEVNGKRLGPYTNVSGMMAVSPGGHHIAWAAEKAGKWVVAVDGVEKYTVGGLLWPWMAWSPSLEGNSYIPQTRAAVLRFSPDGESLAFPAKTPAGIWALYLDGKPGSPWADISSDIDFVAGRPKYYAFDAAKRLFEIHGAQELGPYDSSWRTIVSANGKHYILAAKKGAQNLLVVDDREREIAESVSQYQVGDDGSPFYVYGSAGKLRVRAGNADAPGEFDEVRELAISPDGRKAAFWGRRGAEWTVYANGKELAGFGGYYYYQSGSQSYSLMWSADSQHVAYYTRNAGLVLDGEELKKNYTPPGLQLQVIVDDRGRTVGAGLMSGPRVDPAALVQAVLMRDSISCDPFSVSLVAGALSCIEQKGDGGSVVHIGDRAEGPWKTVRSTVFASDSGQHYAYIVETAAGAQAVIDGTPSPHVYSAIYRPGIDDDAGAIEYLAVRDGSLLRVVEPFGKPVRK
jgi:hypothetical protein